MRGVAPCGYVASMETAGTTPRVSPPLGDLAPLLTGRAPVATVVLSTEANLDNPGTRTLQRWKPVRAELALQGAPDVALDHIEAVLEDAHHDGAAVLAVADDRRLLHLAHGPETPARDGGWWSQLPRLGPAITWRQDSVPHVVVMTDRAGADLTAVGWHGDEQEELAGGNADPLRKSSPGGWSQKRFQQRAENTWEKNAGEVAAAVVQLVEQVGARAIVVAGDERAIQLLTAELPPDLVAMLTEVPGGRGTDGSEGTVSAEIHRMVATAAAANKVALLDKLKEELGQADRAVVGVKDTLAALTAGQVAALLVHDGVDDDRTAWFGDDPIPVSTEASVLRDLGVDEPRQARLVDVAIRAALGTSADVHITPAHGPLREGIGALLRWR